MATEARHADPAPRRRRPRRLSKRAARVWAWAAGAVGFVGLSISIGVAPKPHALAVDEAARPPPRQQILVKETVRRVVVHEKPKQPAPQIRYVTVFVPASGGSSAGGSARPPTTTTSGS